ncbi:MAG TPA: DNA translocase FtsK 4TM domain-containing protein [Gemmataceae bacterium]|nr:DNA translocase FtsK 4TM domain-containing protein [Gemmataceae bacterium]
MSDRRSWRLDAAAGVLLLLGLLLTLAVIGHDPADLDEGVYPLHPTPHNFLGLPGAWVARALVVGLGHAAYFFLGTWFVLVLLLLLRRGWLAWGMRLVGWLLLTPCAAILADRYGGDWPGCPPAGPGGAVGAWLSIWLNAHFMTWVQVVLIGGCVLAGLALGADFLLRRLPRVAWWTVQFLWVGAGLPSLSRRAGGVSPLMRRPAMSRIKNQGADAPRSPTPEPKPSADVRPIPIVHHHAAAPIDAHGKTAVVPSDHERYAGYKLPPLKMLEDATPLNLGDQDQELRDRAALLEKTFTDFGLNVRVVGINTGPVVTQFELALETGLRLHKVTALADDVALNLKAPSVRMVAPIPGKNTVGVEIPNEQRAVVRLKEVILAAGKKIANSKIPLFLGKDAEGRPLVHDLADMPHLLIAGATGTGKSVCMNAIILSMLMTRRPDELKMIMIDPKVVELSQFGAVPHLMHPVINDMKKAEAVLAWAVDKMEERYDLLARARVRNVASYNELKYDEILRRVKPADDAERETIPERMPFIVIFLDEMADLIMLLRKEVEGHIIRLTQKSRAAGIHLVLATQRPSVDVITGLIKSNLPSRICFKVSSKIDSRVVLDEMGADKLLGKGDLLFLQPGAAGLIRCQGAYASDEEIHKVVDYLECEPSYAPELMQLNTASKEGLLERLRERDDLYEAAVEVVVREQRGSVSLLQRTLGIGYGRAARLIDFMAEDGIVGGYNGSNAREVLYTAESWAALRAG